MSEKPTITDKRARAYDPACHFCHDSGCPACAPTIAQRFADRVRMDDRKALLQEAGAFIESRFGKISGPNHVVQMTAEQFGQFVFAAMEYGAARAENRTPATGAPASERSSRFENLEILA